MYPSNRDPVYGTFVKVFYEDIQKYFSNVELVAIKGKRNGLDKIFAYLKFYIIIFFKLIVSRYDFVYIHTIAHPIPPIRAASLFRNLNLVFNIHGDDLLTTTKLSTKLRNLSYPLLKNAKQIIVPTDYFKDILIEECPWINKNIIFISPSGGINLSFFKNTTKQNHQLPVVGYVSRIDKGKGWEYLLCAIHILVLKGHKLKVEIVGSGFQVSLLEKQIFELGLQDIVSYRGALTHAELPDFYHNLDWFVFPTYRKGESLGLVGLEAMASMTPVIGSDIAGLRSYIVDGVNGFLIPPQNSEMLASTIERALTLSKSEIIDLQNNAYNTALRYESSLVNKILFEKLNSIFYK